MKLIFAILSLTVAVRAQEKPTTKPADFDPEVYRQAMERLNAKSIPQISTTAQTIEELREENAALRQRIADLEVVLGMRSTTQQPTRQARTFTTFGDLINTIKLPADPKKKWTELQREKAQHDIEAAIIGAKFQATMKLDDASGGAKGFICHFSRKVAGATEGLTCKFDARYSDLITSWKVGQSVTFVGVISSASIYQRGDAVGGMGIGITLSDCVPK